MNEYQEPLPNETYLTVILLDDGGCLINDCTFMFFHNGYLVYWDVKYYEIERQRYHKIAGKNHTYYVDCIDKGLARKIAIAYHKKLGKHEKWTLD